MGTKTRNILVIGLSILGFSSLSTGIYLNFNEKPSSNNALEYKNDKIVEVINKEEKINISLKNIEIEQGSILSLNVLDYFTGEFDTSVLYLLKLDTTNVDTTKLGTYPYTIKYKTQLFEGSITVKEKEAINEEIEEVLEVVEDQEVEDPLPANITTKDITIKKTETLSKEITTYVEEEVTAEMLEQMVLDLNNVNMNITGTYQYKIAYKNKIYVGKITVTEDQPIISSTIEKVENSSDIKESNEKETESEKDENIEENTKDQG